MMAYAVSEGRLFWLKTFRMVSAARQRSVLRIPNTAFLISVHHAGRNVRRLPRMQKEAPSAEVSVPPLLRTTGSAFLVTPVDGLVCVMHLEM